MFGFTQIAAIVVICYLIGEGIKLTSIDKKDIPVIVGVCGGLLGIVAYYVMPGLEVGNVLDAVASGIVSGLASCGTYEAIKNAQAKSD